MKLPLSDCLAVQLVAPIVYIASPGLVEASESTEQSRTAKSTMMVFMAGLKIFIFVLFEVCAYNIYVTNFHSALFNSEIVCW